MSANVSHVTAPSKNYAVRVVKYNYLEISRRRLLQSTWCVQVLRSPKEAFAAVMQSWRERCEKCVCLQGDYIEK